MPERIKLTEKVLRDAEPVPGRDYQIFDTEVRGFAACIYRGGGRAFTLDYRHAGRQRRMTFGRWPEWSVSAARERAKELRREIDAGADPLGLREAKREAPRVTDLIERYCAEHLPKLSARGAADQRSALAKMVEPVWGRKLVTEITPTDVDKLLTKIAEGRARPHKEKPNNRARKLQGAKPTPVRANRIGEVLRKMFTLAVQWGWCEDNPAQRFHRRTETPRESRRRIDLLGIDRNANLVVIELKRTEDGGHMELQSIRYAAMVSTMTFAQAADVFGRYLAQIGKADTDARAELLDFLGWDEPDEDAFAQDVRIVLASAEFSRELTTSVLWLIERGIDLRCVRLQPYGLEGRVLVDVQQIIPLPEVAEYQVRVTEKKRKEREARTDTRDWTSYDVTLGGRQLTGLRKRHAIYQVFRHLVERGIAPEKVAQHCGPRANRALVSVEGEVAVEDFHRLAKEARVKEGRNFDPGRYFCGEDELLHFEGRTYAFLNQWGGRAFDEAMADLRDAFPDNEIAFAPSEQ